MSTTVKAEHPNTNPQREDFYVAIAQAVSHGFTLTSSEVGSIGAAYGYDPLYVSNNFLDRRQVKTKLAEIGEEGIDLQRLKYRGHRIYVDASLELDDTDFDKSRAMIDKKFDRK